MLQAKKKHFANDLPTHTKTKLFLEEKITKCKQHAIGTLINTSFKERVFYGWSEQFVSNRTAVFQCESPNASDEKYTFAEACQNTNLSL